MNIRIFTLLILGALFLGQVRGQQTGHSVKVKVVVAEELQSHFKPDGRLFIFFGRNQWAEPRTQTWPGPWNQGDFFAVNMSGLDAESNIRADPSLQWTGTADWSLDQVPGGEYRIQVLWDQDLEESGINAPGNLYSTVASVMIDDARELEITLDHQIGPRSVAEHRLVREIDLVSDTLSAWWGRPVHLKATILLPGNYREDSDHAYPIRYNVAGYGGRYTRINQLTGNKNFMEWWTSDEAPQVINVFLDGEGPFGDSYQLDSDNSGPYGYSLIHELIPHIESAYRGTDDARARFVDGCSTGGWVSLALQIFYPEWFNGAFSYSPDAINFENYQLVNIYQDENAFINEFGYIRPIMRDTYGEPMVSWKEFVQFENVLGASDNYLTSGGQICSHTALYGPKGENGLPKPLIDPETGKIDHAVAEHWKAYDLKLYCQENWEELGPKLEGKIFIWMGDMDHFYLNTATRAFAGFINQTENPGSDAEIVFSPMEGHCSKFAHREVLMKIQQRLDMLQAE
jgi:S-formylglutathione hydrolase FrmB